MSVINNTQRHILTMFYGYAYSMERDLSTSKMEEKARNFLDKYGNDFHHRNGGGYAEMLMEQTLESKYKNKFDESTKRARLAIAIGFEMTCAMVKLWPSFMLPLCRFILAPSRLDKRFQAWATEHSNLLKLGVPLINGLNDLPKDIDPWEVIFSN